MDTAAINSELVEASEQFYKIVKDVGKKREEEKARKERELMEEWRKTVQAVIDRALENAKNHDVLAQVAANGYNGCVLAALEDYPPNIRNYCANRGMTLDGSNKYIDCFSKMISELKLAPIYGAPCRRVQTPKSYDSAVIMIYTLFQTAEGKIYGSGICPTDSPFDNCLVRNEVKEKEVEKQSSCLIS